MHAYRHVHNINVIYDSADMSNWPTISPINHITKPTMAPTTNPKAQTEPVNMIPTTTPITTFPPLPTRLPASL